MARYYVDPAALEARLPSKDGGWDPDLLVAYVVSASEYVDTALPNYWPFPDHNATPVSTPQIIRDATLDYAIFLALGDLGEDNAQAEGTSPEFRRERCDQVCEDLVSEKRKVKPVAITSEELTFGTDEDWPDLAFLAWTRVEILEEATEIAGYEYGADFEVGYSQRHRKWALKRRISEIEDGAFVSYEISWLKRREIDQDVSRTGTIEVERA